MNYTDLVVSEYGYYLTAYCGDCEYAGRYYINQENIHVDEDNERSVACTCANCGNEFVIEMGQVTWDEFKEKVSESGYSDYDDEIHTVWLLNQDGTVKEYYKLNEDGTVRYYHKRDYYEENYDSLTDAWKAWVE